MANLWDRLKACDDKVRTHLDANEEVLAIGRCEDITDRGSTERAGNARTYVMVTSEQLRWVPFAYLEFEASLRLDDVAAASEESSARRYAIGLEHKPILRDHWESKHFLVFRWGTVVATVSLARTRLAFSRPDTDAAIALREQLAARELL